MPSHDYWTGLLMAGWDDQAKFNRARNFEHVLDSVTAEDVAAAQISERRPHGPNNGGAVNGLRPAA